MDQGLKRRVAVIGGGWAGLAAAVELCSAGIDVTLFEAAPQLGGRARRVDVHGHTLDNGQHILIGAYRDTLRLMQKVGADPKHLFRRLPLDLSHPAAGFRLKLPNLPAPLHLAFGLLAATGCPITEKLSAVRFMRALQGCQYQLPEDIAVSNLLERYHQHGQLRRFLWEPLCLAALNTTPENASAQIFANVLRDSLGGSRSDTDLLLPATDLGSIFPDAAAQYIIARGGMIRLSHRIEGIDAGLNIVGEAFDDIVLATAPQHAVPLLQKIPETAAIAATLNDYRHEPIGTVYIAYPLEIHLPATMIGLETPTGGHLGQWAFDRGQLCGNQGIISFVLSAHGRWDERDNDALANTLHDELQETLCRELPRFLWHRVIREKRATFSCRPNLPRPATRTPLKGLWLAGDYVCAGYPATLEGAMRSGTATAQGILSIDR